MQIKFNKKFNKAFLKIPPDIQNKITVALKEIEKTSSLRNIKEYLKTMQGYKKNRVQLTIKDYRAIFIQQEKTLFAFDVGHVNKMKRKYQKTINNKQRV